MYPSTSATLLTIMATTGALCVSLFTGLFCFIVFVHCLADCNRERGLYLLEAHLDTYFGIIIYYNELQQYLGRQVSEIYSGRILL